MTNMTMRDKIAAIIDKNLPEDYDFGVEAAAAILAALPGLVVPLVWEKSHTLPWDDDYHSLPTAYTIRCADENGWKWSYNGGHGYERSPEAAMAAANAHNAAAVCKAMGLAP